MLAYRRTRIPGRIDANAERTYIDVVYKGVGSGKASPGTTITISYTVGSDPYRLLIVAVSHNVAALTSVTYNGTNMTQFGTTIDAALEVSVDLWYMVNPPSGAHNVVVTASSDYMSAGVLEFYNVDQITPLASYVGNTEVDGSPTIVLTGTAHDIAFSCIGYLWAANAASSDGTARYAENIDGAWRGAGCTKAGAASVSIAWTTNPDNRCCAFGVMVKSQ